MPSSTSTARSLLVPHAILLCPLPAPTKNSKSRTVSSRVPRLHRGGKAVEEALSMSLPCLHGLDSSEQ